MYTIKESIKNEIVDFCEFIEEDCFTLKGNEIDLNNSFQKILAEIENVRTMLKFDPNNYDIKEFWIDEVEAWTRNYFYARADKYFLKLVGNKIELAENLGDSFYDRKEAENLIELYKNQI